MELVCGGGGDGRAGEVVSYLLVQISLVESEDARRGGNVSVRSSLCV